MLAEDAVDRFLEFMCKRERLRLRKEAGERWPWSDDEILNTYKFTNVKREHDRTTRWMRHHWTGPNERRPSGEIIFNCALFRYFGTWEFADALGWQRSWRPDQVVALARRRSRRNERVFTGAYIIPTLGYRGPKCEAVAHLILTPLWNERETIGHVAVKSQSWRVAAERLSRMPGFGGTGFMAKEILQDVMQTPVLRAAVDRNSWCPAGPGARRGLNRIAGRRLNESVAETRLLCEMRSLFQLATEAMPKWMPTLELHDIQFQLCEFDKYERVRLGQGRPKSKYKPREA